MYFLLISVFLVLFTFHLIQQLRRPRNFPPGPSWLPIVGNYFKLQKFCHEKRYLHEALATIAHQHNTQILGLKIGSDLTIVVFGFELVKEVWSREEFEGRPDNFFTRLRTMGVRKGITTTDGLFWHEQRSFVMRHMRHVGFGTQKMEHLVSDKLLDMVLLFKQSSGPVDMGNTFSSCVLNVLWHFITGTSFSSHEDPRLHHLLHSLQKRNQVFDMAGGILNQFPWLRFLAPEHSGYNLILRLNAELKDFFMTLIKDHQLKYSPDKTDDLIDAFLHEMEEKKEENSTFTIEQLIMICMDFFIAGTQTTRTVLDFLFLMMLIHPNVQKKAQKELDQIVGRNRLPRTSDRTKLPYIEAIIMEVQRMYTVVPVAGPRRVMKDTNLCGYNIPKNTTMLISVWSVHHEKKHWTDPDVFRPERHINKYGQLIFDDWILPFGFGRRRCLGEALAKNCIFLFFAGILQQFEVFPVPGTELPAAVLLPGLTLSPQPYTVLLTPRADH